MSPRLSTITGATAAKLAGEVGSMPATDRRPPRCGEHTTRYRAGCVCCRGWANWYNRRRRRRVRSGTWGHMVEAARLRVHIRHLMDGGMRILDIAADAELCYGFLTRLVYDRATRRATPAVAEAILAVRPRPADRPLVDAAGTRRRIQALGRIGWARAEVATRLGVHPCAPRQVGRQPLRHPRHRRQGGRPLHAPVHGARPVPVGRAARATGRLAAPDRLG